MVLVLAIIAGVMSIIQTKYIPQWDYQKESQSFSELVSEVSQIPSVLTSPTTSTSLQIKAGVEYPQYPFLVNPPSTYGVIRIVPEKLTVSYTIYGHRVKGIYNTSAIIVRPVYLYKPEVELVYEYGAIIEYGKNYARPVILNQVAFSNNEIDLPVVESNPVSLAAKSFVLHFYLLSKNGRNKVSNLTISFESQYPELWANTLKKIYGSSADVTFTNNLVTVKFNKPVYLSIPAWSLSTQPVGNASSGSVEVSAVIAIPSQVYVNSNGGRSAIEVQVLDRYGNPLNNVTLAIGVENESVCRVLVNGSEATSANITTGFNGIGEFYVEGIKAGKTKVEIRANLPRTENGTNETCVTVNVTKVEGAYNNYEIVIVHANASLIGYYHSGWCCPRWSNYYNVYGYNILVRVTENGVPVKNVPVNFYFLDFNNNILFMGIAYTNSSGYAEYTTMVSVKTDEVSGSTLTWMPSKIINTEPTSVLVEAGASSNKTEINYLS